MIPNELFEQVELDGAFSGGIVVNESSSGGTTLTVIGLRARF